MQRTNLQSKRDEDNFLTLNRAYQNAVLDPDLRESLKILAHTSAIMLTSGNSAYARKYQMAPARARLYPSLGPG